MKTTPDLRPPEQNGRTNNIAVVLVAVVVVALLIIAILTLTAILHGPPAG